MKIWPLDEKPFTHFSIIQRKQKNVHGLWKIADTCSFNQDAKDITSNNNTATVKTRAPAFVPCSHAEHESQTWIELAPVQSWVDLLYSCNTQSWQSHEIFFPPSSFFSPLSFLWVSRPQRNLTSERNANRFTRRNRKKWTGSVPFMT